MHNSTIQFFNNDQSKFDIIFWRALISRFKLTKCSQAIVASVAAVVVQHRIRMTELIYDSKLSNRDDAVFSSWSSFILGPHFLLWKYGCVIWIWGRFSHHFMQFKRSVSVSLNSKYGVVSITVETPFLFLPDYLFFFFLSYLIFCLLCYQKYEITRTCNHLSEVYN